MAMKTCSKCGLAKARHPDFFRCDKYASDGLQSACKECQAGYKRKPKHSGESAAETPAAPAPPEPRAPEVITRAHVEKHKQRIQAEEQRLLLEENLRLRAELQAALEAVKPRPASTRIVPASPDRADAVACAVASDWHIDELVDLGATQGLNEYNPTIAEARARRFFQNYLRLANIFARDSHIKVLHLAVLGDLFSGWIHEELRSGTAMAPPEAARFAAQLLEDGLQFLLDESDFGILVDALPGNHGRITDKVHRNNPTGTSLETLAYQILEVRFRNEPRVEVNVAQHAEVHRRFFERFKMRLIHGYEVKYAGGVGGPTIPINKRLAQWNSSIPCQLTVMGHFHHYMDGGNFMVNGSLIGHSPYAQSSGFAFEEPKQAFFLVHARNGGEKSVTAPIWLDDGRKP